jgi:hypothetical protein
MTIKLIAQIIFFLLAAFIGLYSAIMIYVLIRFGQSRILGMIISIFYLIIIIGLYSAAVANFDLISFPNL